MFCYNCGKEIDDKAIVCVGCGVPTGKQNVANNVSGVPNTNSSVNANPNIANESSAMKGYDVAIITLSIIGLAVAGLCFLFAVIAVFLFWIPLGCGIAAYVIAKINKSQYTKLGLSAMIFAIVLSAMLVFLLIIGLSFATSIPGNIY